LYLVRDPLFGNPEVAYLVKPIYHKSQTITDTVFHFISHNRREQIGSFFLGDHDPGSMMIRKKYQPNMRSRVSFIHHFYPDG